jgi:ABC-2 type transport system ATP-binding protein
MIEVTGLTRYYGHHAAVQDVSFNIENNQVVGFLGLNGAGKSTTLKILAGLLLPSAGSVSIDGVDVVQAPDSLRASIGFLPEDAPLYTDMRVREFVVYCGRLKGMAAGDAEARVDEVLSRCDLSDRAHQVIDTLSHGYRKRVGIAQAIIHSPKLVILDEPISGLDPVQIREIRQVIVGLKKTCTVLISSHILSEISQTCDRILVLKNGSLVASGTEDELSARLSGGGRLVLELRGDADAVVASIEAFEGAKSCTVQRVTDDVATVEVVLTTDEREKLVQHVVAAGFGLRRLDDADGELEEIFLNIMESAQ